MRDAAFERKVERVMAYAFKVLRARGFTYRRMQRNKAVAKNTSYLEGHTSLETKQVVIDIYTARLRKPKKMSAILAVLAHEVAHHQKKPYRERYKGRWITRAHYPKFYAQVNKNIAKLKKDRKLKQFYE